MWDNTAYSQGYSAFTINLNDPALGLTFTESFIAVMNEAGVKNDWTLGFTTAHGVYVERQQTQ